MRILKHLIEQPFIFATGMAALAHSTWSLATLFSGKEPQQFTLDWLAWISPALLIAFSLDIGQIVTSSEIRAGQRSTAKYLTFAVFAIATYYLQWLYIAHHMPLLQLASGVRETWVGVAAVIRDAAVWFIPALLPLSTLLYTFSHNTAHGNPMPSIPTPQETAVPSRALTLVPQDSAEQIVIETPERFEAECSEPGCDWSGVYESSRAAQNALSAHRKKHGAGVEQGDNGSQR